MPEITVTERISGQRLDKALSVLCGIGLRGAARMIADGDVLLNAGRPKKSAIVRAGDQIRIPGHSLAQSGASVIGMQGRYCFFYKPPGIHTVALAGRCNGSLEQELPSLCAAADLDCQITLLQRLDYATSGLICCALDSAAAEDFRIWQKAGKCSKYYHAVLSGRLAGPVTVKSALLSRGRRMAIGKGEAESLHWTGFEPIWQGELAGFGEVTLARCLIRSGQRHQIRVHAASIGHPLSGDGLYGNWPEPDKFLLSHYRLEFPGHMASCQDKSFRSHFPQLAG